MLLCAPVMPACEREQIDVRTTDGDAAYGRRDLISAIDRFTQSDRSPAQFRALAETMAALSPRFNDAVAREAERNLVLLALHTLEGLTSQPPQTQLEALATTIWPIALRAEPGPGESASVYAERVCSTQEALRCKDVVPEYRAIILAALVWTRLEERARLAVQACDTCRGPEFTEPLSRYALQARSIDQAAQRARAMARPDRWPRAGKRAAPWSGAPVLSVTEDGDIMQDERPVTAGEIAAVLAGLRARSEVLGLHLEPAAELKHLRRLLADMATTDFAAIALQVRMPEYPYMLAEYRIALRKNSVRPVRMRDIDTVQVLVQALDALSRDDEHAPLLMF